jgi:hypothetical protein
MAPNRHKIIANSWNPFASVLTPFVAEFTLRIMGDKSPKATHKQAAQKQAKASAAKKKNNAPSAKQVPKPK